MDRRTTLKSLGSALAGLTATGVVSARGPSKSEIDTGFDPSDRDEVLQFVDAVLDYSESHSETEVTRLRRDIRGELSAAQKQAVARVFADDIGQQFTTAGTSPSGDLTTQSQFESYSYTISAAIEIPVLGNTYDAYDFVHTLDWFYEGDSVEQGTATVDVSTNNYALVSWSYAGLNDSQKSIHPDDLYVRTFREGLIKQKVALDTIPVSNNYPSCWVQGDNNGDGSAYDVETK